MQLAATRTPAAPDARPAATAPAHGFGFGTLRPGGANAPAPDDVVAQAVVQLPMNFGAHALIDVSLGKELGHFDTLEDARAAARTLTTAARPAVGVTAQMNRDGYVAYRAVELLVPDLTAAPFESSPTDPMLPGWEAVHPTALRLGVDEARGGRFIESLVAVDHEGGMGTTQLVEVAVGRHARLEFEYVDGGRVSRFQPLP